MEEFLVKIKADSNEKLEQRQGILKARQDYFRNHKAPRPGEESFHDYQSEMFYLGWKLEEIASEMNRRGM